MRSFFYEGSSHKVFYNRKDNLLITPILHLSAKADNTTRSWQDYHDKIG